MMKTKIVAKAKKATKKVAKKATKKADKKVSSKPDPKRLLSLIANPFREGTKAYRAYEIVAANPRKTIAELKAIGAHPGAVNEMMRRGMIHFE